MSVDPSDPRRRLVHAVPYYSQFASRELVGEIIRREREIDDDPRWQESGASSLAEYLSWADKACGMACLQMVLAAEGQPVPPIVELCRECESHRGYRKREDPPGYDGLYYAEFCEFAADRFGLTAKVAAPLTLDSLREFVTAGDLVMASVHPSIRHPSTTPPSRGGHLILVIGVDSDALCIHNPSGDTVDSQEFVWLGNDVFTRFYAERGVIISPGPLDYRSHSRNATEWSEGDVD
jgi:Peptidase_C39 like family